MSNIIAIHGYPTDFTEEQKIEIKAAIKPLLTIASNLIKDELSRIDSYETFDDSCWARVANNIRTFDPDGEKRLNLPKELNND